MLLKIRGYELEILQGKFVCLGQNDGETSHFSEWKYLDPRLQEKFQAIRASCKSAQNSTVASCPMDSKGIIFAARSHSLS